MSRLSLATTIPALVEDRASLGTHPAIIDGETTVTYAQLHHRVDEVARAFLADGVTRGDRVAVWAQNRVEFILALLGAQTIGAIVVPLNTRFTGHEVSDLLERSGASVLVVADGFLGKSFTTSLKTATADKPSVGGGPIPALAELRTIVHLDEPSELPGEPGWAKYLAAGAAISADHLATSKAAVTPDDVADILYTSGTTGQPKGVMSAHRQTIGVAYAWAVGAELTEDDRYAAVNPYFHGFGYKAGIVTTLVAGATMYPVATLDTTALLQLIESSRITVLPGVPTVFTSLLDHPKLADYDTSSLRFATAGATTAPESLFHDMKHVLGFQRVAQAYGLSECVVATMSRLSDTLEHTKQTTGPSVPGIEIRVVDDAGHDVPVGGDGEVLVRGADVMLGYYHDEAATRAALDDAGWLHTGDVGQLDEHGCLKITDRLKDMFIVGGFNVYPAEIENVLRKHPAVNESAVIGIDDARLGSVGRAYVALRHDADPLTDAVELDRFCRERLANFKVPREFILVEDFPRTGAGKILKLALREAAAAEVR